MQKDLLSLQMICLLTFFNLHQVSNHQKLILERHYSAHYGVELYEELIQTTPELQFLKIIDMENFRDDHHSKIVFRVYKQVYYKGVICVCA